MSDAAPTQAVDGQDSTPLLEVRGLTKHSPLGRSDTRPFAPR
jgi:hypothetical protein